METTSKTRLIWSGLLLMVALSLLPIGQAAGQPYGTGYFGADVPYGGQTSLAISTSGNVSIELSPSNTGTLGTTTSTVTVTSTDVVGYNLYINSLSSTNMSNGGANIPASGNVTENPLGVDTWGYNTDASTNFIGITTSQVLLTAATGPYESGNNTTVTYGIDIDNAKPAGQYTTNVVYTAVPQTT